MGTALKRRLKEFEKLSVIEGVFAQIFNTLAGPGSAFITKFAIMLNATPFQFGILSAIGQGSQIFQPFGAVITRSKVKRKSVVISLQLLARATVLLYALLPFAGLGGSSIYVFLLLFLFSVSMQAMADNAWIGWMTDLIPHGARGRYFSLRTQYMLFGAIAAGYLFSIFIDSYGPGGSDHFVRSGSALFRPELLPIGFLLLFFAAASAGVAGVSIVRLQPETGKALEEEDSVMLLLKPLKDSNFRKFLFYNCWWMAAVGIGAPFWQPFMMQKLGMSLFEVQVYGSIYIVSSLLVLRFWGRLIDAFGNRTAMRLVIILGGLNPMIWLFVMQKTHSLLYLEAVTSGIMWAGAGLISNNFAVSIAPKGKLQSYAGVSSAFAGAAMTATMLLSGAFLPSLPQAAAMRLEPEQILFALTGVARWSALMPLSRIHEPGSRTVGDAVSSLLRKINPGIVK